MTWKPSWHGRQGAPERRGHRFGTGGMLRKDHNFVSHKSFFHLARIMHYDCFSRMIAPVLFPASVPLLSVTRFHPYFFDASLLRCAPLPRRPRTVAVHPWTGRVEGPENG